MSEIWNYFYLSGRIAFCKAEKCNYQKDFPPKSSTTNLAAHLQHNHPKLFNEFKEKKTTKEAQKKQQPSIKRLFLIYFQVEKFYLEPFPPQLQLPVPIPNRMMIF